MTSTDHQSWRLSSVVSSPESVDVIVELGPDDVPLVPALDAFGAQEGEPVRDWDAARWPSLADVVDRVAETLSVEQGALTLVAWVRTRGGRAMVSMDIKGRVPS